MCDDIKSLIESFAKMQVDPQILLDYPKPGKGFRKCKSEKRPGRVERLMNFLISTFFKEARS